jgi:hypothetical protein
MSNPNAIPPKAYQWKKGQSGNPQGLAKGTKHLSTWIQEMLNDESFSFEDKTGTVIYEGAPIKAIIGVAVYQSMNGNKDARAWLAQNGYGTKLFVNTGDPVEEALRELGLLDKDKDYKDAGKTKGSKS